MNVDWDRVFNYVNPIARLGQTNYSILFPFIFSVVVCVLSEIYALGIAKNPKIVGVYIIFINIASIIYFSFRDGTRGGFTAAFIPIVYYLYIIYTRNYGGRQLVSGLETTAGLAIIYFILAWVIGWLRKTIDQLIERESDEKIRLQSIIQQLPVGIVVVDSQGVVTHSNKIIELTIGTKVPLGFILGKNNLVETRQNGKLIHPQQSPLYQALNLGKPVVGREVSVIRQDGKEVYLQVNASPVKNKAGKIIAAVSILSNITQQKEAEKRKDDFINMASHELKTPITSMKLYLNALTSKLKEQKDPQVRKILKSIKYQTDKLQELVSDLLDVSRIQTGKLSFDREKFRLNDLVKETIDGLQGTMDNHKINFLGKENLNVYADRFRIYQVLTNLITNAAKYSSDGTDINVRIRREGRKAIISVQDFGIGIAKDQQKRIFDRLYQVMDDKEKTFPGFGMGLYIAREIIKRHRGNIWVESEKGKGSTFYFSLPMGK